MNNKFRIIIGVIAVLVLVSLFCWGGNTFNGGKQLSAGEVITSEHITKPTDPYADEKVILEYDPTTPSPKETESQPDNLSAPSNEDSAPNTNRQDAVPANEELTCSLSIRCDTILNNLELLTPEKQDIIPTDGIIFAERTVPLYEGDSVFDLLLREMKKNKIHMEFVNTPVYNSAYIEGISNIYEFGCGELSGWMYKVNGIFPKYGCSGYLLKDGDRVEWVYSCDLGRDIGGSNWQRGD